MRANSNKILADYQRLRANIRCSVDTEDYRRVEPKLRSVLALAEIENRAVAVYDLNTQSFLLKRDDHLALLGYLECEIPSVNDYHAMIHPDDLPFLCEAELMMYHYLHSPNRTDKQDYKLVYDYRVRAADGRYIRFIHQMQLFELDRCGNSWLLLIISDLMSSFPGNEKPRRFLLNIRTKEVCLFQEECGVKRFLVTGREREILGLISQGLESSEIADRLCISLSTVNNHRQHILQKTATRNSTQAVIYLRCIGVL